MTTRLSRSARRGCAAALALGLLASPVSAQDTDRPSIASRAAINAAISTAEVDAAAVPEGKQATSGTAPARAQAERSATRRVLGAIAGGAGGFFAGGYLGAMIEGDACNCDDPGFKGFLIGMPIGTAVGAILGWKFLF